MAEETLNTGNLLAKYKKIISNFKKISKIVGMDRALDICDVPFKFNVFHFFDYSLVLHYIFSAIYIICTKFENKMDILRPLTLCPISVQVMNKNILQNKSAVVNPIRFFSAW